MVSTSPADVLGSHAFNISPLVVKAIRSLHNRFAEAHQISKSRTAMGFGSQWRDLLADVQEALTKKGYRTYKLLPAGYTLPVVNNCLVYVWRVPGSVGTTSSFASGPTRLNGFTAKPLDPMLFEPGFTGEPDEDPEVSPSEETALEDVMRAAGSTMPLVLVMVRSSPQQLQSIEWAVAKLDEETGKVALHGKEIIWQPELSSDEVATAAGAFDSGPVDGPTVEPQEQEGTEPDA